MKIGLIIAYLVLWLPGLKAQQNYRIYINEFLASNVSINADIVDFDDYSDWIELYNDEDVDIDIGNYFITDNFNQPAKYQLPAQLIIPSKGYLLLWADGYNDIPGRTYRRDYYPYDYYTTKYFHLSFSLSRASEEIALFNADTSLVDSVTFSLQERDVSMGRKPDGSSNWYFFGDPTPDTSNNTGGVTQLEFSKKPILSVGSGFYNSIQYINISANASNYQIKYTLDGSKPDIESESYTQPIPISETSVLRVRVYELNKLPSKIYTYSYFINEPSNISAISLTAFPETLFDNQKGIYDNQYKSREVPVTIEYFEPDRSKGFAIDVGLRMTGQASIDYPQKSFTISTDENYGKDVIDYQVFPNRKLNTFTELYIRNAGVPDNRLTMFRDGALQDLVFDKIDIDCQSYVPTALFINGEYWGIYNIREKVGTGYLASLHNINPDDIDLLEYNLNRTPEIVDGQRDEFVDLINYFGQNDLSVPGNYEFVKSKMDIDEYINYYITEIYYDNIFWLNQNVRVWKERRDGKKWRWILFDTDNAFGADGPGISNYQTNTLQLVASSVQNNVYPLWSTLTFRKLIENDEFKVNFIQKFSSYMNTLFQPDTVISSINKFKGRISTEIIRHISRWNFGGVVNSLSPIANYMEWENNISKMTQFAINRPSYQRQHIINTFNLSGTSNIIININANDMGKVIINNFENVTGTKTGIYFKDIPIELKAVPEVGYRFVKWLGIQNEFQNPISFVLSEDSLHITAQFEPISITIIPSEINQNTTLTKSNSPYYANGTIKVNPNITLVVESGVKILMPEESSILVFGNLVLNGLENDPVIIEPNENSQSWGALCIVNATDSSIIKNLIIKGATKGPEFTRDKAAISSYNSNLSLEGIMVEDVEAPIFIQFGNVSIKRCSLYTTISGDLINVKQANYALVEDCDLRGNDEFDSDAIDFDRVKSGVIRNNKMYNIYGFNSDAIDLGEGVVSALIENNIIFNVNDKGVSIGGASKGIMKRNIIANCGMGVGIKDYNSYGYMENNTFYANQYGIASFEKNIGRGGGSADVVNCIIANSKESSLLVDDLSYINVSYSLSNTNKLSGNQNIRSDPEFINNLRLSTGSPAIDKGSPSTPNDPDGTISDIGAIPFEANNQINLLINEIHYNPLEGDNYEFVELVNAGNSSININGFRLDGDIAYQFGSDTISAGEYFLIAKDKNIYTGQGYKVFQWQDGALQNNLGNIFLKNNTGSLIDFANYDSNTWWPKDPNGLGPSMELINPSLENMVSSNWQASKVNGGTPGKSNNSVIDKIFINEFMASNNSSYADEYGEFDDWIEIYNANTVPVDIGGLFITDDLADPLKYQVPNDSSEITTVLPNSYLLLWADGQIEQGKLHLSFKLNQGGEPIGLVQVIENYNLYIDTISYAGQSANVSYGRRPDGSNKWYYFEVPTPLESNGEEIPDNGVLPTSYSLSQNFPNPFNSTTKIRYAVPEESLVKIIIYDMLGCKVATVLNETKKPGSYEESVSLPTLSSGVYFYRIETPNYFETKKMILLK